MKRTIGNCSVIKTAIKEELASHPETEVCEGKIYCQGYEGSDGDPYYKCLNCKVSIHSLEERE